MLESYPNALLLVAIGLLIAAGYSFYWVYRIGRLMGEGHDAAAEASLWRFTLYLLACAAIELVVYTLHVPLFWIIILGFVHYQAWDYKRKKAG